MAQLGEKRRKEEAEDKAQEVHDAAKFSEQQTTGGEEREGHKSSSLGTEKETETK